MLLLAIAIAPSLAICVYIFYRDRYNREPAINLVASFIWGMIVLVPAIALEMAINEYFDKTLLSIIAGTYLGVGLLEELSKFLVVRFYCFTRKSFDEPLDGIVYSVMVAMGFATIENSFYAHHYGMSTAIVRMLTSVPAHATFAVIMGYYIGLAKFDPVHRSSLFLKGILAATAAHGTYDVFLFLNQNAWMKKYVSELLLFTGAIASLFIAVHLSRKLIGLHQSTSQQLFHAIPALTIRKASVQDIELIRDLSLQVWPQTYSAILTKQQIDYMLNLMYSKEALQQQMDKQHQFLLLYNAGVPIGFASFSEREPAIFKLHKIYILPAHQGKGAGRFLIEYIIKEAGSKGAAALQLNVNRYNHAKDFYERLGFQVIGSEDIDIGDGYYMNDNLMERKLTAHDV